MDRPDTTHELTGPGAQTKRARPNTVIRLGAFVLTVVVCILYLDALVYGLVQPLQEISFLVALAEFGQFLGNRLGSILLVTLVIVLAWRRWKKAALIAVVASLTQSVVVELIKALTGRPRPIVVEEDGISPGFYGLGFDGNSFPSGHAAFAFTLATVAAAFFPRARKPIYALAAFIAITRIMLDKHYLSDVAVGAMLGCVIGAFFVSAWMPPRPRDHEPEGD